MEKKDRSKKLKWGIAIGAVTIIVVVVAALSVKAANSRKEEAALEALNKVYSDAITGGIACEDAGNMIKKVWNNAIFKNEDPDTDIYTRYLNGAGGFMNFNDALSEYFLNGDYTEKVGTARAYEGYIKDGMKELDKVPKALSEHYAAAKDVRSAYKRLLNVVDDPSGNLEAFSNSFQDADTNLADACDELKYLLEDAE